MGHSSLLGIDRAATEPAGRDTASLGPGDSSDSGSDVAGADEIDTTDPTAPLDVALRDDAQRTYLPIDSLDGAPSDAAGTGERRSAGSDAGGREAADISVDRVFDPAAEGDGFEDDEDPDLAFVDVAEAGAVLDDEEAADAGDAVRNEHRSPDDEDAPETDVEGDSGGRRTSDDGVEGNFEDEPESDMEGTGGGAARG